MLYKSATPPLFHLYFTAGYIRILHKKLPSIEGSFCLKGFCLLNNNLLLVTEFILYY
jgi:hypothetical protein